MKDKNTERIYHPTALISISNDRKKEDIPEKKKAAIGVRGMKLGAKDSITDVYYTQNAVEQSIEYKSKKIELNKLKLGSRDTKGVKVRV